MGLVVVRSRKNQGELLVIVVKQLVKFSCNYISCCFVQEVVCSILGRLVLFYQNSKVSEEFANCWSDTFCHLKFAKYYRDGTKILLPYRKNANFYQFHFTSNSATQLCRDLISDLLQQGQHAFFHSNIIVANRRSQGNQRQYVKKAMSSQTANVESVEKTYILTILMPCFCNSL